MSALINRSLAIADAIDRAPAIANRATSCSSRFVVVPTIDIVNRMLDAGFTISSAKQVGNGPFGYHAITFRLPTKDLMVGDAVPEIVLTNAANGTHAFRVGLGLFRFICLNGLVVGTVFASYDVDHRMEAAELCFDASQKVIGDLPLIDEWYKKASTTSTSIEWRTEYARRAALLRWGNGGLIQPNAMSVEDPNALLAYRRDEDRPQTVWHVYNRVQENVMRGGTVHTLGATGRRTLARSLSSAALGVQINRGLFDLTNEMLKAA